MKIGELIELIGVYEPIRILDEEFTQLHRGIATELPEDFKKYHIKSLYSKGSEINIITTLDKHKRKWYNKKED